MQDWQSEASHSHACAAELMHTRISMGCSRILEMRQQCVMCHGQQSQTKRIHLHITQATSLSFELLSDLFKP